jgi:hypothetical protein
MRRRHYAILLKSIFKEESEMSIMQLQQRVLSPNAGVDYSTIIRQSYPPEAVQREAFVGFKVLCRDSQVTRFRTGEERMCMIDQFICQTHVLQNTGVILRATHTDMPDGIWVITMPVPRSQINQALTNLFNVLTALEQYLGIFITGNIEVNASGRCHVNETVQILGSLNIPPNFEQAVQIPNGTPFKHGHFIRINDFFGCYRIRYSIAVSNAYQLKGAMLQLAEAQAVIYR